MNILTAEAISNQIQKNLSIERFAQLWRFVLTFFSADYFIHFNWDWIGHIKEIKGFDDRTMDISLFIGVYILIYYVTYKLLQWPFRWGFHGRVKSRILEARNRLGKKGNRQRSYSFIF